MRIGDGSSDVCSSDLVGERIADLHALVEARAADHAVRQAEGNEALLELAGLRAGAHQDGDLLQVVVLVARDQRLDLLADEARLGLAVPQAAQAELLALLVLGPQRLAEAALVVGDAAGGGGEDATRRADVAAQAAHIVSGPIDLSARGFGSFRSKSTGV